MSRSTVLAICALVAGCSGSGAVSTQSGVVTATSVPEAAADDTASLAGAAIVNIIPAAERTVCRREFPLGTRIARERCYVVGNDGLAGDWESQLAREDFEMLRQQQIFAEQARQQRAMQQRSHTTAPTPR